MSTRKRTDAAAAEDASVKVAAFGVAVAVVGVGLAIAGTSPSRHIGTTSYPPGCTIAIDGAPGYLPRATVTIENRSASPVQAWLEPRMGVARVDFGQIGEGAVRPFGNVLPAGRNLLRASERGGRAHRIVLNVANHGAGTCKRRYVWRIE
jgi:hypothetical protein